MRIYFLMQNSKRQLAFSAVLAMLLYLVPNLVQDIHRVWGHHQHQNNFSSNAGIQLHSHYDKCAVCVFEFNVVDELPDFVFDAVLHKVISLYVANQDHQIQNTVFNYYNLRAPPGA